MTAIADIHWPTAHRIIRSIHPPNDLFEDIADPEDWPLLLSAEMKTNPRLVESVGQLDLLPTNRRVGGPGASWLMAPFTHTSPDRPSRFSDGRLGVLYVGNCFEVALYETIHHHEKFMANTAEKPGWTSQFRELLMSVSGRLHDLRGLSASDPVLDLSDYRAAQILAATLRAAGSDGIVSISRRYTDGEAAALFYPDLTNAPRQSRHLAYHWNGTAVDYVRDESSGTVYRVER